MKSRLLSLVKFQAVICIVLFLSSCRKQADTIAAIETGNSEIKVENGHLVFRTFAEFSNFMLRVNSTNKAERKKMETELGFTSLATMYEEVNVKIENSENPADIGSIADPYNAYFKYSEKGLEYKNENDMYANVIDKNGLFKIGDAMYKSINKGRIIATTKDYSLLEKINSVEEYLSKGTNDIKIDRFVTMQQFISYLNQANAGPYDAGTNKHYLISVRNESNSRRLYVEMIQYNNYFPQYSGTTYTGFGYSSLYTMGFSHTKKGTFGTWSSYTSPTYISEIKIYNGYPPAWNLHFSGTLNNNSSSQSLGTSLFGTTSPMSFYSASEAASWAEPILTSPVSVTCTGNGQNWYTNTYL